MLDRTARHSADLRVRYLRVPTGSHWVQRAVTRAFFAFRSMGTVVDRQRLIRPQPHSRHSSQHPAPSWVLARRSSNLRLGAAQLHIRHIVLWPALRASSELVLPSPSRPAQQTCPSACPCLGSSPITVASPIMHTPARSESARQSAPRGGCRFVVRSAGFSH